MSKSHSILPPIILVLSLVFSTGLTSCASQPPVYGDVVSVFPATTLNWILRASNPTIAGTEILLAVRDRMFLVISVPFEGGRGVVGAIDITIKDFKVLLDIRGNYMSIATYNAMKAGLISNGWQLVDKSYIPPALTLATKEAITALTKLPTPVFMVAPAVLIEVICLDDNHVFWLDRYESTPE